MKNALILIMALMVMLIAMPVMASACGGCLITTAIMATADTVPASSIVADVEFKGGGDADAPGGAIVFKETSIYSHDAIAFTFIDSGGGGCHAIVSKRQSYMATGLAGKHLIPYARDVTII